MSSYKQPPWSSSSSSMSNDMWLPKTAFESMHTVHPFQAKQLADEAFAACLLNLEKQHGTLSNDHVRALKWPIETQQDALSFFIQHRTTGHGKLYAASVKSMRHALDTKSKKWGILAGLHRGRDPLRRFNHLSAPTAMAAVADTISAAYLLRRLMFWAIIGSHVSQLQLVRLRSVHYLAHNMSAADWIEIDSELLRFEQEGSRSSSTDMVAYGFVDISGFTWDRSLVQNIADYCSRELEQVLIGCDFRTFFDVIRDCVFSQPATRPLWTFACIDTLFCNIKVAWLKEWFIGLYIQLVARCEYKAPINSLVLHTYKSFCPPVETWDRYRDEAIEFLNTDQALRSRVKCRILPPLHGEHAIVHKDLSSAIFARDRLTLAFASAAAAATCMELQFSPESSNAPHSWEATRMEGDGVLYGPRTHRLVELKLDVGFLCVAKWLRAECLNKDAASIVLEYAKTAEVVCWSAYDHERFTTKDQVDA